MITSRLESHSVLTKRRPPGTDLQLPMTDWNHHQYGHFKISTIVFNPYFLGLV